MNLYQILDVEQNVDFIDLKQKYNELVLKLHPDKNNGNDEEYKKVVNAYTILSDSITRKQYNLELQLDNTLSSLDIYHSIWNNTIPIQKNNIINSNIDITILELYQGLDKMIEITTKNKCIYCYSGCSMCNNTGLLSYKINYVVHIDKGCKDGDILPIYGIAIPELNYISINEINNTNYVRKGSNLYYILDISLKDALNNTQFTIKYLDDSDIEIPSNQYIRPDTTTTIKNKGMPIRYKPGMYGDLIIRYNILYPDIISTTSRLEISKLLPIDYTKNNDIDIIQHELDETIEEVDSNQPQNCPIQ